MLREPPLRSVPVTQPDGLLPQHNLLGAVIDSDWATRLDIKVAHRIIARYYSRFGNARASLRFLERATGARRPNVIASVRRLTSHGVFSVIRPGEGTRPTEYGLNFAFSASGIAGDTASENERSGIADDTSCGIADDTSSTASGIAGDTESYLLKPADKPGLQVNSPSARLRASAAEAAPASAEVGFEDFWLTYPRRHQKPKARAAWAKLDPDADLAARIVAASRRLAEHYAANPVDPQWIPEPANWLAGERYDEDLPAVFEGKPARAERQQKANKPKPANSNTPAAGGAPVRIVGGGIDLSRGEHLVEVAGWTESSGPNGEVRVTLDLQPVGGGETRKHTFFAWHDNDEEREAGQATSRAFARAIGGNTDEGDVLDPVGKRVWAIVGKTVDYRAAV